MLVNIISVVWMLWWVKTRKGGSETHIPFWSIFVSMNVRTLSSFCEGEESFSSSRIPTPFGNYKRKGEAFERHSLRILNSTEEHELSGNN
jgi:hypothetical protein